MSTNKCPHPACQRQKPFDRYACYTHWKNLPKDIQNKIWNAYRNYGVLSPQWLEADKDALIQWKKEIGDAL